MITKKTKIGNSVCKDIGCDREKFMSIDYNKVSQINSAIDKLLARMKEIDDTYSCLSSSSLYRYMSEERRRNLADYTESLQKERACLFKVYLKDVEELHACFNN